MEGYSVTEAASVLGVPVERVWELLARGVLAGAPEGETGMRVFLQPRAGSAPAAAGTAPPPENGGSREPERELSPFRELLTEFRNLTERYGQALLALGESRGEVAALRSRVDLLEARMDLGLPGPAPQRMAPGWGTGGVPYGPDPTVVPTAPPPASEAEPPPLETAEEHRARPRGPRRATQSFAEALARAEDPSPPELPPATAEADDHPRHEPGPGEAEAALPRELPAAEPMPISEEPEPEAAPEPEREAAAEPEPSVAAMVEREPMPVPAEPLEWDADRYTTAIDEPDWFEAEADEPAPSAEPPRGDSEPSAGDRAPIADDQEPSARPSDIAEEAGSEQAPAELLPGGDELDSALEALGVVGGTPASAPEEPRPRSAPEDADPRRAQPAVPPSALRYRPVAPPGPTGRAYRRLRRIFPE